MLKSGKEVYGIPRPKKQMHESFPCQFLNSTRETESDAMSQSELDFTRPARFNGSDYDHEKDSPRLTGQILRVFNLMRDGQWRSLSDIAHQTGDPEASVSAQLRHLRKPRFGAHEVRKQNAGGGLFHYQLVPNTQPEKS